MKKLINLFALVLVLFITSCVAEKDGDTTIRLTGDEKNLPDELKGLRVYSVKLNSGGYVRVAILNNQINSTTYSVGKMTETTIILNPNKNREIVVKEIISENDSIIVCKK